MKPTPLNDLEMFELLQAAYPEKFPGDDEATFEAAQAFADSIEGWEDVADLLGRVAMLTMPTQSPLTGTWKHVLGTIVIADGSASMLAAVKRDITWGGGE